MNTFPKRVDELPAKPSIFSRATDALRISTPEGRAARQQRKDARAAVPRSIGKGAVYAPLATDVVNAYKPRQVVAVARDSATLQVATNAVAGKNNTATQTAKAEEAKDWKAELASPVGKLIAGTAAVILLGTALYGFVLWRKKKQADTLIS